MVHLGAADSPPSGVRGAYTLLQSWYLKAWAQLEEPSDEEKAKKPESWYDL